MAYGKTSEVLLESTLTHSSA